MISLGKLYWQWHLHVYYVIMALVAILLALSATHTLSLTPDSIHYTDIARTLAREYRFATYHLTLNSTEIPDPVLLWPPVYPALLAIPQVFGADSLLAARIVDMLAIFVILSAGMAVTVETDRKMPRTLSFALLAIAVHEMDVFGRSWSEPVFSAFMVLFLLATARYVTTGRPRWCAMAGVIAGAGFLSRYIGVVMLACGVAAIVLRTWGERDSLSCHVREFLKRSGLFLGCFAAMSIPWILRNAVRLGRPFGPPRPLSQTPFLENAAMVMNVLKQDLPCVLLAALLVPLVLRISREVRRRPATVYRIHAVGTLIITCTAYLTFLALLSSTYRFDPIDHRLVSPVYFPVAILTALGIDAIFRRWGWWQSHALRSATATILLLGMLAYLWPESRQEWGQLVTTETDLGHTEMDRWILANTPPDALIVGQGAWTRRFLTGRTVLETGYPSMPPLTREGIREFLNRHDGEFPEAYLACRRGSAADREMFDSPICYRSKGRWIVRRID